MISASQLRQAKAMLNLDQATVCDACGINKATLSNIENEKSVGNATTISALQLFYESNGLEFIDGDGVRRSSTGLKRYKGSAEFREFYTDIYNTVKGQENNDIWIYNGVSELVFQHLGQEFLNMHVDRMIKIKDRFRFRVVVKEGDDSFLGSTYCEYKYLPSERFHDKTTFIYGSKTAFLNFDNDDVTVIVLDQPDNADQMRHFYEWSWSNEAIKP